MTSDHGEGSSRRKVLECMTWAGTGILWTVSGGVPKSLSLLGHAEAAAAALMSVKRYLIFCTCGIVPASAFGCREADPAQEILESRI